MKNAYTISGDTVSIALRRKNALALELLVDLADLPIVTAIPGTISAWFSKNAATFYAIYRTGETGKRRTLYLHRLLTGASPGLVVDHRDHNGLNNTRQNLRVVEPVFNSLNRRGLASNNTSGIRGVHLHKPGRWRAMISSHGRMLHLGLFATKEEAEAAYLRKLFELDPTNPLNEPGNTKGRPTGSAPATFPATAGRSAN